MEDLQEISVLSAIRPIGNLSVPQHLDGRDGENRVTGKRAQIAAKNDIEALTAWLARYENKSTTFNNYRKEAERLLYWSTIQLGKPLSSLTHEDFLVYKQFLRNPQPADLWVLRPGKDGPGKKVGREHPDWRPFAGPLSEASVRQAIIILNTMFSWLVNAGYLAGNPLSLSRDRKRVSKARITRYLSSAVWTEVKVTIETMAKETERDREHYHRTKWLFSLLYLCGLRISEVVENDMSRFFCRRDNEGQERWWLEVLGKGDKLRIVPATNELMAELTRYRRQLGMSPFPARNDATPLLLPIGGKERQMTRAAIHGLVKKVFTETAGRLEKSGEISKSEEVKDASAHWLRHTAGSHMANKSVDLRHVRDNLGHESLSTTSGYLHSEDDARHRETEEKHKIGW